MHEPPQGGVRARHFGKRFGESGDGDIAIIIDQIAARFHELRAGETGDSQRRIERAQLARQRGGVEIAGRFSAREEEPQGTMTRDA